jgi:hypothetical protein
MTFFGTRALAATFFLTAVFLVALAFEATLDFTLLRAAGFCATALFAFGRLVFAVLARRLATAFDDARRATVREVERLRLLLTALISA